MAVRTATTTLNSMLEAWETAVGTSAVIRIYTGAVAGSLGSAPAGTLLATITLTGDAWSTAAAGSKSLSGTPSATASASGTAGCYTLSTSGGTILEDGNVSTDLVLNNTSINSGQTVTVTAYTKSIS